MIWIRSAAFILLLLAAAIHDLKRREIPDRISLLLFCTGFLSFEPVRLVGLLVALPLLIAALITENSMGGGDIKLMAAAGFVLGFRKGLAALIFGLTAFLLFYIFYAIIQGLRGRKRQRAFPLAPFLSAGCMAAYFL